MKKFTLIAAALFALTASAQLSSVNRAVLGQGYAETTATAKSNVNLNEAGPADIAGTYVYGAIDGENCNSSRAITITKGDADGAYTVAGFFGFNPAIAVNATYNAATGELTIAAGQNIYNSTYGATTLCLMPTVAQYNKTSAIVFTFDADGNAELNGAGLIAMLFEYGQSPSGGYYNLNSPIFNVALFPANGTITNTIVDNNFTPTKTTEYPTATLIDGDYGLVVGLDGMTWESFTISDNAVTFDLDDLYNYDDNYANAIMTAAGKTTEGKWGYTTQAVTGTIDKEEGTIVLNMWQFILKSLSASGYAILNGNKAESVITFPAEDPQTGISDVKVGNTVPALDYSKPVFNLAGQQVTIDESSRGFFIQNGHKYVK
ncbi:MAG: hypothetical protein KBT10_05085 [Bacteroidales bacterium]|nr:hypothetical protein [Candidatus Sodaliphilus aphodohippi]